jgi:hypothetical protein
MYSEKLLTYFTFLMSVKQELSVRALPLAIAGGKKWQTSTSFSPFFTFLRVVQFSLLFNSQKNKYSVEGGNWGTRIAQVDGGTSGQVVCVQTSGARTLFRINCLLKCVFMPLQHWQHCATIV